MVHQYLIALYVDPALLCINIHYCGPMEVVVGPDSMIWLYKEHLDHSHYK